LQKHVNNLAKIYQTQHPVVELGEIIKTVHNGANIEGASIYVEKKQGIPYILVKSITKEGIDFENLKYINYELKTNRDVIKNTVSEDTILMTRAGNAGICANIPPDLVGGVASGFLINIHVDLIKVNPYYLVSFLNSDFGQFQLERVSSGSILQSIRSSDLRKIKVILPPIEIQNQIGEKVKKSVLAKAESRKSIEEANFDIQNLV